MTNKELRALQQRLHDESQRKAHNKEYPINKFGVMEIPALSIHDKPDDVSEADWKEFWAWVNRYEAPPRKNWLALDADEYSCILAKRKDGDIWEDAKTGKRLTKEQFLKLVEEISETIN